MIGNDIVDLKEAAAKSNWQRRGFLDKIFTQKEQQYIYNSVNSFQTIWRLWSMKESAYKIYSRQYQKRIFNPKALECDILDETKGEVRIQHHRYFTSTTCNEDLVYTIATLNSERSVLTHSFLADTKDHYELSALCYKSLKQYISDVSHIDESKLIIKKNRIGIPHLYCNDIPMTISFSITHHGNYGAYTILQD